MGVVGRWAWSGVQACPVIRVSLCPGLTPCPQGLSPPSWPPGHISCQQEAAFPAPGPSHGPRPLPGHASRSLPDTCCPRSRSARRLPKDGRYVQFSPSLIPGDTRLTPPKCVRPCAVGGSSLPALPDGASHEHAARPFPRHCRPYLAPALLVVQGDGRTPTPAPGAGITRKSFSLKPCALICGRKAKNSTAFVALFRD